MSLSTKALNIACFFLSITQMKFTTKIHHAKFVTIQSSTKPFATLHAITKQKVNHVQNHIPPTHTQRLPWTPCHRLHRQTNPSNPRAPIQEPQRAWHPLGQDRNWGTRCPRVGKMTVKKHDRDFANYPRTHDNKKTAWILAFRITLSYYLSI